MSTLFKRLIALIRNKFIDSGPESESSQQNIEEEMLETLERASTEGSIDLEEDEREMISSIFELGDTRVQEIMVPRIDIKFVKEDYSYDDIRKMVVETGHSRLPLVEDDIDDIIGIIFVKDLYLNREKLVDGEVTLKNLARKPLVVPEGKKLDELLRDMKRFKNHFAVVIDEYGGTAGMVTLEDVLEEIVGEITDEFDQEVAPFTKLGEGHYLISARTEIKSLNETLHLELPAGDYETLAGFLISELGDLPRAGEQLQYRNLKFTVRQAEARAVKEVELFVDVAPE